MKNFLLALTVALLPVLSFGQSNAFPDRPIKLIVHLTPGSGSDSVGRFLAERMSKILGQTVVVENKPGANGNIAVMAVRSAPADGHTLLLSSISTLSVNPIVLKNMPYDPVKDLRPVAGLVRVTSAIVVPSNSPHQSFQKLVESAKKRDLPLQYGNYAPVYRLAVEWLGDMAGIKLDSVPYKGAAPMLVDLIAGRLDFAILDQAGAEALSKGGKVRQLAVTSEKRSTAFPSVPTVAESGYPEFISYPWIALHVRSETPEDITAKLTDAVRKVLATEDALEFVKKTPGTELMPFSPVEMQNYHTSELNRFKRLADKLGIKPE